jgi:hypothetical protein
MCPRTVRVKELVLHSKAFAWNILSSVKLKLIPYNCHLRVIVLDSGDTKESYLPFHSTSSNACRVLAGPLCPISYLSTPSLQVSLSSKFTVLHSVGHFLFTMMPSFF